MKLVFPCFVVSVAVLIAAFGCKWTRPKATGLLDQQGGTSNSVELGRPNTADGNVANVVASGSRPQGNGHHIAGGKTGSRGQAKKKAEWTGPILNRVAPGEEKKERAYFIRKPGDTSLEFETNIIATPAMFIVKKRYKSTITYDDAKSLKLDLSQLNQPQIEAVDGHISDVMLAKNDFYLRTVDNNIALIKLTSHLKVRYMEEPDFVQKNLNWIQQNFDRVRLAQTQQDLTQEMSDHDVEISRGDHGLLIRNYKTPGQKICGVYFIRSKRIQAPNPYTSLVFATRASCVVKSPGTNGGKFRYYPIAEFILKIHGHSTYDGEDALGDLNDFETNDHFKFGQEGFQNDIALVPLILVQSIEYLKEPDYVRENQIWIRDHRDTFYPDIEGYD